MSRDRGNSAIAKRLVQSRLALGYKTQSGFADQIGIRQHQYNVFETGSRRISLGVALLIWEEFGVSLDWIYFGDASGLPTSLRKKLNRTR